VGYELEQAVRPFETIGGQQPVGVDSGVDPTDALTALVERVLQRRRVHDEEGARAMAEERQKVVRDRVSREGAAASVRAVADEIHLARLFERVWDVAWETRAAKEER
jgi:hypothetical protein